MLRPAELRQRGQERWDALSTWQRKLLFVLGRVGRALAVGVAALALFGLASRNAGGAIPTLAWAWAGFFVLALVAAYLLVSLAEALLYVLDRHRARRRERVLLVAGGFAVLAVVVGVAFRKPPGTEVKPSAILFQDFENPDFREVAAPRPADVALATRFRPHLFFDTREAIRPLDVDAFLAERDAAGRARTRVCTRVAGHADPCAPVTSQESLYPAIEDPARTYLDLADDTWRRHDVGGAPQRIYFHVAHRGRLTLIDYWWFFRYNISPVLRHSMCLAGLSIADATCFDHEGDWEGVTVAVTRAPALAWVTYAGHDWPGYRYRTAALAGAGSLDGEHARVYVAYGSHASYPVACRRKCDQLDFRHRLLGKERRLPDGRHNGAKEWAGDDDEACAAAAACVAELPLTSAGLGAGWNAYDGYWGRSECAAIPLFCVRTDGPPSPSFQKRFASPIRGVLGSPAELRRQARLGRRAGAATG